MPARDPLPQPLARPRHRLALVLGSGGVRSAAAIGVAQVLEHAGLRPTLIVGCSSGALFAAGLALRLSTAEFLNATMSLWSQELTNQRRWWSYVQLLLPRLARFGPDFALRDSSLIGQRIHAAFGGWRIEQLPTRLRVVATEADSGRRVVLTEGDLVRALRASMAVPFIFPAIDVDGRRLIDGVVSDPLPVSVADDADVVLTLGFEGAMPRRVARPAQLFGQVSTALLNNLMQARLESARHAGQRIVPLDLQLDRRTGLWETAAMPRMVQAGADAAMRALPALEAALRQAGTRPPTGAGSDYAVAA